MWDATKIQQFLDFMRWKQPDLARELGTTQANVSNWVTGKYIPKGMAQKSLDLLALKYNFKQDQII